MTDWTKEMDAQLVKGVHNKLTARMISEEMGVTRNAVLGRLHRLKISLGQNHRNSAGRPKGTRNKFYQNIRHIRIEPNHYIDLIMDMRDMGMRWKDIAEQTGLSVVQVRTWAIAFGGYEPHRANAFSQDEISYLIDAWRKHDHVEDMADKLGRSYGVIRQKILQLQRAGMLNKGERDPNLTRILRRFGEKALEAGSTPQEALRNIAAAKQRAFAEAINVTRMAATKRRKIAVEEMLKNIEGGMERNQAIFIARTSGANLQDIGEAMEITRERVRQICFKHAEIIALQKLLGTEEEISNE